MAILKQIEKYIDYYNQYINQSLNLAEKTSELLRKKRINQLAAESIDSFNQAKTQEDIIKTTQQLSKQALELEAPEAIQGIYAAANLQTKVLNEESQRKIGEYLYSSLNLDEYRVVNGELKTVKDVLNTLSPELSTEEKLKVIQSLPKPKLDRGLSVAGNSVVETYADATGNILKSTEKPIIKKNGQLLVEDEGQQQPVDFNTQYQIYLREKDKEQLSIQRQQLEYNKDRAEKTLTYGVLEKKIDINKQNLFFIKSAIVNRLFKQHLEEKELDESELSMEEKAALIEVFDKTASKSYNPYIIKNNEQLLNEIDAEFPGFKQKVIEYIKTDEYIQTKSKLLDYELTNDSDKKYFAQNYDDIVDELMIKNDPEVKRILNNKGFNEGEKVDLIYKRYKVLTTKKGK